MKKILGLLLAMILAIGMCGCSSGTSSVKEYNIDEFLPTYRKILSSIEEKTQYWSEDELQSSKYTELVKKEAESGGFSLNQTIIIRGKVDTTYPSFLFISTSKNSNEDMKMKILNLILKMQTSILQHLCAFFRKTLTHLHY